jgi:hypothetical protein
MKCCPKCGSTNVNPLVFYRPSIWRCLDCGYEGAFIVDDGAFAAKMLERYRGRGNIIDPMEGEPRMDDGGGSADNWPKSSEDRMKSVDSTVEDNDYAGLRL